MGSLMPDEMAKLAEDAGITKAKMSFSKTFVLTILDGVFISFGAIFTTTVTAEPTFSVGFTKLIGGITFSLELILVIVGGAELFTGNNIIEMAWANKRIKNSSSFKELVNSVFWKFHWCCCNSYAYAFY